MLKTSEERQVNKEGFLVLPDKFTEKKWNFEKVTREGKLCIYRKWKDIDGKEVSGGYEVFFVQNYPERIISGIKIPAKESLPTSELWGVAGWTEQTEDAARQRFENLKKSA